MKQIDKISQKGGDKRKNAIKKIKSNHGVHKRGNCPVCQNFNDKRNDKIKIHVFKVHPDKYVEFYGAPNGDPNGAPGDPNGAPNGAPDGAPNGDPNGAPDGAPNNQNVYIHKPDCKCFAPGLIVDASTQTRIRRDNIKQIILFEKSKSGRRV